MLNDEQPLIQSLKMATRALISAEVSELTRIFADDYVQYDESGKAATRARSPSSKSFRISCSSFNLHQWRIVAIWSLRLCGRSLS